MTLIYPVIEIPENAAAALEQVGTKFKFWYEDDEKKRWLFKIGRSGTGENWAEKAASELAELIGLPHAGYDLAIWQGLQGVRSPWFLSKEERLVLGNELLSMREEGYESLIRYQQSQHTVRSVMTVMRSSTIHPPSAWNPTENTQTAAGVFVGYLMLDAWIGNTDRHHENWGWVNKQGENVALAPTFDHASSLGRELTDDVRTDRLNSMDERRKIEYYLSRAKSALYRSPSDKKPISPIEAFYEAASFVQKAAQEWLAKLEEVQDEQVVNVFANFPGDWISKEAVDFALKMLSLNRSQLMKYREEAE